MPRLDNSKSDRRKLLGAEGEKLALEHILQQNYKILAQNWRCRTGELDLIAEHEAVIVFIEVRTRRKTGTFGFAQESVDFRKQRKVRETAQVFLQQRRLADRQIRFDVVTVHMEPDGTDPELQHIVNAF
ncbi:YraN family protein [Paenibacillus hamazuiensis]|uniref:YraN family protein n=1 Tax=Paenibacillus hamazuiensis TaxID=2936508 RepID=UPI00200CAB90|nr:YraN family protein [Paenibacillus hamazuiensis]